MLRRRLSPKRLKIIVGVFRPIVGGHVLVVGIHDREQEAGCVGVMPAPSINKENPKVGKVIPFPTKPHAGKPHISDPAKMRQLSLDLAQIVLDIAGFVDPTPISDGANAIIAVARGNWVDAGLSVISIVPYIGDLAKAGKFPKYLKTVENAINLARESADTAKILTPIIQRIDKALDLLPANAPAQLTQLRRSVDQFLHEAGVKKLARYGKVDVAQQFKFRQYRHGGYEYKEAVGRLGVPDKVKLHRSKSAQTSVSAGKGDDAGHLVGDRFGAPGGVENLSLQNWRSNRAGTYKQLENQWAAKLKEGTGIEVEIRDITKIGESRPFGRNVKWKEIGPNGGVTQHELLFLNPHTPKSRAAQHIPPTVTHPPTNNVIFVDFQGRKQIF